VYRGQEQKWQVCRKCARRHPGRSHNPPRSVSLDPKLLNHQVVMTVSGHHGA
jgi:hypothetical protein